MELYGITILWAARYDYFMDQNPSMNLHRHDFYQMVYYIEGSGTFELGERKEEFRPGDIFFIPPGSPHRLFSSVQQTIKTLDIKFHIEDVQLALDCKTLPLRNHDSLQEVIRLLEKIRLEGLEKNAYFKETASLLLLQILYLLLRLHRTAQIPGVPAKLDAPLQKGRVTEYILQYIQEHFAEEFSQKDIAKAIGYSRSHIRKSFMENMHCTIAEYCKQWRIEHAKELITYSDYTLKQIAEKTGFKNIHHFSRVFKSLAGVTPGDYRIKEKEGIRKDIVF